jgi:hypothetical protein
MSFTVARGASAWSDPQGAPLQRVQTRIGNYECGDTLLRER